MKQHDNADTYIRSKGATVLCIPTLLYISCSAGRDQQEKRVAASTIWKDTLLLLCRSTIPDYRPEDPFGTGGQLSAMLVTRLKDVFIF